MEGNRNCVGGVLFGGARLFENEKPGAGLSGISKFASSESALGGWRLKPENDGGGDLRSEDDEGTRILWGRLECALEGLVVEIFISPRSELFLLPWKLAILSTVVAN